VVQPSLRVIVPFILLALLLAAPCCRQVEPEPVPISLLDQLDPDEPLGPWRLAAEIRGMRAWTDGAEGLGISIDGRLIDVRSMADLKPGQLKRTSRVMGKGGAFIQTAPVSTHRQPVAAEPGERLILGLRYGTAWAVSPLVEVRLLKAGEVVVSSEADVHGHWCEAQITVPTDGVDTLEIRHHLDPGTAIAIREATLLAVEREAAQEEIVRAKLFLRLARGDRVSPIRVPEKRLVPLELDGRTQDVLLLSSGEIIELAIPPVLADRELLCWFTVLEGGASDSAALTLEAETGGEWRVLAQLPVRAGHAGTWTDLRLNKGDVASDCRRIRFTITGRNAIVGVSGPVLPAGRRPGGRKNLLVIDLDTLRADRMETYGYGERPTTGRFDALLGQRGFHLFEHAYSPAVSTLPATAKLLSGRYHDIQQKNVVPRSYTLLQEWLRDAGYYCTAFTGGGQLRCRGFEQGFHEFFWSNGVGKIEDSFPQAVAWLQDNVDELFFLFLHTYETHTPYSRGEFCAGLPRGRLGDLTAGELLIPKKSGIRSRTPLTEPEKQYVNAAYDSGVKKATEGVVDLLHELDRLGLTDSTVVVILSDHGEEFWDHAEIFAHHGQSLYGELLNVPLIVFDPDRPAEGMHRIAEEVSTVDLMPTVLELLGLSHTAETDGVSLVPLMEGGSRGDSFHREIPVFASRLDKSCCVIRDGVKYISSLGEQPWLADQQDLPPGPGELFLLTDDPRERSNLADIQPELRQRMSDLLRRAAGQALPPLAEEAVDHGPVSHDLQRQLRALGYVGGK